MSRRLIFVLLLAASAARAGSMPGGSGERARYLPAVVREASALGLPPEIADAVAMVETGYTPGAVGSAGEVGLMQVMPATASQLGFRGGVAELADPATNIRLGVAYLARAWAAGGEDICRALTKYRAGLGQEVVTPLSARYCARAISWLTDGQSRLPAGADGPLPAAADAHVAAMLPLLPEQAALLPAIVRPTMAPASADAYQLTLGNPPPGTPKPRPRPRPRRPGSYRRYLRQVEASIGQLGEAP